MPGPVSDSYDSEFGTSENAGLVYDGIKEVIQKISDDLGPKLLNIVDIVGTPDYRETQLAFNERELRIIRFSLNRALETI